MGRRDLFSGLALFAVALGYFSLTATRTIDLRDEGYLIAQAIKVAAGALPHRDFSDVYGPGVLAATAAALRLGGGELLAVRLLLMLCKAASVLAGFAIARQIAPRWAAIAAAVLGIAYWGRLASNLNVPYGAIFTLPLALLACWLLARALGRDGVRSVFAAGVAAGAGILFKQSLGAMLAFGMFLSIFAFGMLRSSARVSTPTLGVSAGSVGSPASRLLCVSTWILLSLGVVVPVAARLGVRDYLLHFAPVHLLCLLVALAAWRGGGPAWPRRHQVRQGLAFALGAAALPAATLLLYASMGGLPALVDDMLLLPLSLRRYALPAALPPASLAAFVAGFAAVLSALLLALADRRRAAIAVGALGLGLAGLARIAVPAENPRLYEPAVLLHRAPFALEGVLLPALLIAAMALGARRLLNAAESGGARTLGAWLPLLFMSGMLAFEVFPRAGQNLWILHGALLPLFALVIADWSALAKPLSGGVRFRWAPAAASALVLVLPLWAVAPLVPDVLWPAEARDTRRPLAAPQLQGLAFSPQQIAGEHLDDLEDLLAWLATEPPAPLFTLSNEAMLPVLAERPAFFDSHRYAFFLAGWGMLPRARAAALDSLPVLEELRRAEQLIVVRRNDPTAAQLRSAVPKLSDFIAANFLPVARFGVYQVLRRDLSKGP